MATYTVNQAAVARCRELISKKQYVLDCDWGDVQPDADGGNAYLERHSWEEYAAWHLGLTEGANDETKARHAFVYGDLRRIHRTGLIACVYRATEWRHKEVELAAHHLLQELDKAAGIECPPRTDAADPGSLGRRVGGARSGAVDRADPSPSFAQKLRSDDVPLHWG